MSYCWGMTLRMAIPHAQSSFLCCHFSYINCEIRHEILLVTGFLSYKSVVGVVLDFGGPSDSSAPACNEAGGISINSFITLSTVVG